MQRSLACDITNPQPAMVWDYYTDVWLCVYDLLLLTESMLYIYQPYSPAAAGNDGSNPGCVVDIKQKKFKLKLNATPLNSVS